MTESTAGHGYGEWLRTSSGKVTHYFYPECGSMNLFRSLCGLLYCGADIDEQEDIDRCAKCGADDYYSEAIGK